MHAASDRRRLLRAACAALAGAVLPARALSLELRVIALRHRLAAELIPALQPLLGPGETVTGMDSRLVVQAAPASLARLERAIAELDVARRNLRITVRHLDGGQSAVRSGELSGELERDGSRVIVTGDPRTRDGLVVGREGPDGRVQLQAGRRSATRREQLEQTLVVMDGGEGLVRIGESIPVVQPFLALVGERLQAAVGVEFYDVSTGFTVAPRLLGDTVQLSIAPRLSFRSSRGMQTIAVRELATTVSVRLGEWLDLGGAVESANELNRQILSTRRSDNRESTRVLVRVD